ncbi:MAG TPA: type II toxin-antitoxin system PemK/MazF family toxin [Thermoanaerobaculia bacterium]|jgi:mRNA interferase MazF
MVIQRGDVWWAALPEPVGSEPGYRRPVVIVQADSFNQSAIRTVIVVALTTNLRLADAPGNVLLQSGQTGLPKDCVANVSQLITADRSFLTERVSSLPVSSLERIEAGLRMILDL